MDAATAETACAVDLHLEHGCVAREADEVDAVGGAEVAQTVGYEVVLVDFKGTGDVRSVAEDDVGAGIDAEVGKGAP